MYTVDKTFKLWSSAMPRSHSQILEDHSWIYTSKRTSNLMYRTNVPVILLHWSGLLHILRVTDECVSSDKETQDANEDFRGYHSFMLNTGSSTDNW